MIAVTSAHRAALKRQIRVAGEEILVDGHPVKALIGSEDADPELGPDGEPIAGVTLTVTIPADSTSREIISQGLPLHVRGRDYGIESWRAPSTSYYELSLYRR